MVLNLGYAVSGPGILKIFGLLLGFMAMVSGSVGCAESAYGKNDGTAKGCEGFVGRWRVSGASCLIDASGLKAVVGLVGIIWVVTLIELIILLLVEIKSGACNMMDCIALAVAGVFILIAALVCLTFSLNIYINWKSCEEQKKGGVFGSVGLGDLRLNDCLPADPYFKPLSFLICGGVCVLNGLIYFAAAVAAKNQKPS